MDIEYIAFADDWAEVVAQDADTSVFRYVYASGKSSNIDRNGKAVYVTKTPDVMQAGDGDINRVVSIDDVTNGMAFQCVVTKAENGGYHITAEKVFNYVILREPFYKNKDGQDSDTTTGFHPGMGETSKIETGASHYLIIKVKSNMGKISVKLGSDAFTYKDQGDKYGQTAIYTDWSVTLDEKWQILVFDLDAFGEKVAMNAEGVRNIDTFIIESTGSNADSYMDIEYIAFADDWAEVAEQAEGADVNYVYASGKTTLVNADGNMVIK